ncbi:MAG: DUF3754 domain-containing protein [Planctomycetota bacterium]
MPFVETRERSLPLGRAALMRRILDDSRLPPAERAGFEQFFAFIDARLHHDFHTRLQRLKTLYEPFDPDLDPHESSAVDPPRQWTVPWKRSKRKNQPQPQSAEDQAAFREFAEEFASLLRHANFVAMTREQIITCVEYQSQAGLIVRASLSEYEELEAFYRGLARRSRRYRPLWTPWTVCCEPIHAFTRVVALVRRRGSQRVYLKLFKNVIAEDLEMLLPHVRIRMRLLDHLKIGSSLAGGMATATWKLVTAAILSPWLFGLIMFGFTGALVRAVFSFSSSKTAYLHRLTRNLFFQNVANNSSMLAYLVDAAESEECKELLLGYYLLHTEREAIRSLEDLDRRAEKWLHDQFGFDVDFDAADALRKLRALGLLECPVDGDGKARDGNAEDRKARDAAGHAPGGPAPRVVDLSAALHRLDDAWDSLHEPQATLGPPHAEIIAAGDGDSGARKLHSSSTNAFTRERGVQ